MTRIILVGFMGAGKTKLGKGLARKLNIPFYDTDQMIEQEEQLSVAQIFKMKGEHYFRALEKNVVENIGDKTDFVLSVGGGLPCNGTLMDELNKLGTTIYLKHSLGVLLQRLRNNKQNRPLILNLSDDELGDFISNKLEERERFYLKSQLVLKTEEQSPNAIIHRLHLHQKN